MKKIILTIGSIFMVASIFAFNINIGETETEIKAKIAATKLDIDIPQKQRLQEAPTKKEKIKLVYFSAKWCVHCLQLKRDFFNDFKENIKGVYGNKIEVIELDVDIYPNKLIYSDTSKEYDVEKRGLPLMVIGNTSLHGYSKDNPGKIDNISPDNLDKAIKKAIANNEKTKVKLSDREPKATS